MSHSSKKKQFVLKVSGIFIYFAPSLSLGNLHYSMLSSKVTLNNKAKKLMNHMSVKKYEKLSVLVSIIN